MPSTMSSVGVTLPVVPVGATVPVEEPWNGVTVTLPRRRRQQELPAEAWRWRWALPHR